MLIREAAKALYEELKQNSWLQTIGIGDGTIYIFTNKNVKSRQLEKLKENGWHGFDVAVRNVGKIRPLQEK
jgi:hypothetical protein